jgi:hypothetical protein
VWVWVGEDRNPGCLMLAIGRHVLAAGVDEPSGRRKRRNKEARKDVSHLFRSCSCPSAENAHSGREGGEKCCIVEVSCSGREEGGGRWLVARHGVVVVACSSFV